MHPASVNFNVGRFESPWLLYTDLTETSKVFCREASMAPIYSLLLFGGQISIDHEKSLLRLDGWASFKAPARIAVLVSFHLYALCKTPGLRCIALRPRDLMRR